MRKREEVKDLEMHILWPGVYTDPNGEFIFTLEKITGDFYWTGTFDYGEVTRRLENPNGSSFLYSDIKFIHLGDY